VSPSTTTALMLATLSSRHAYGILRESVSQRCKAAGFGRIRGAMLGYWRAREDLYDVFWFQVSQDGWDRWAGSKFTLELQRGPAPEPGAGRTRVRFGLLLSEGERALARELQNRVIAKLHPPPAGHDVYGMAETVRRHYLSKFDLLRTPLREREDLWPRYGDREDVAAWGAFFRTCLPDLWERFEPLDRG
jgi:hypothetical protein